MIEWTERTIGDVLDKAVRKCPNKEALVYHDIKITYAELKQNVDNLAKGLIKLGVKPGDRVAIWMPNYPEWVYSNLAISEIGAITTPVNIRFRSGEIEYVLRHSGASCVIMADQFLTNHFCNVLYELSPEILQAEPGDLRTAKFPALRSVICLKDSPGMLKFADVLKEGAHSNLENELGQRQRDTKPDDVVNMFYTSGTTGTPKGALATHNVLMNVANYNEWMEISGQDRIQVPSPLFYTTANYWGMLSSIIAGATMCLCTLFTPEERLEQIEKEKITVTVGAPSIWIATLDFLKTYPYDTSSLRVVWTGGGPLSLNHIKAVKREIVDCFVEVFGMTETAGITMMTKLDDPPEVLANTVGTPLPHFELKIVDTETGEMLPPGKPGELCIRGPYVIKGYLNMPKEEEAIYFDKDGWYHTQDIMVQNENGYYSFFSRIKEMIKVGGENVALNELDAFLKKHPKIKMACTIGVPDATKQEVPLAFIEPMDGETLNEQEIIDYCRKGVAPYKVPRYARFISDWPLAGIGKIQRFKLREMVEGEFGVGKSES